MDAGADEREACVTTFDPLQLLETLQRHGVRFVLIGGQAARVLGSPMMSFDLDVCYDRRDDNLAGLAAALREVNATLRGVEDDIPFVVDERTLRNGASFTFNTDYGPFDVLATPSGTRGYDDLVAGAVRLDLEGLVVDVVSIDDLIRMKRAAGRIKDQLVVEELIALRDEGAAGS